MTHEARPSVRIISLLHNHKTTKDQSQNPTKSKTNCTTSMPFDSQSPDISPEIKFTQQQQQRFTNEDEEEMESSYKRYYAWSRSLPLSFSPKKQSPKFHSQHFLSSRGSAGQSMDENHLHPHSQHPFEELRFAAAATTHATKNRKNNHKHNHDKNMWNLNAIKFFPSYYSLERHHAYISKNDDKDDDDNCGGLDLTAIASNISGCLKAEHVEIRYDQDEAVVYCETSKDASQPDYCKFRINLFKKYEERFSTGTSINKNSVSDSDDSSTTTIPQPTILVEVQRLTGCCLHFSAMATKVLCASKGCKHENDHIALVSNFAIPDDLIQMMDGKNAGPAVSPPAAGRMDIAGVVAW